ncbi:MAG: DNA polymerase I [Peptococcaceae bacterium]
MLIDGNSLSYRAFHALPPLATSRGIITNAVYGFTSMILKILRDLKPDFVAACFDKEKITFRHEKFKTYKAQRPPTPAELRAQFPLIKELLQAMRIPVLELQGYEADDLIGSLVLKAEKISLHNIILTGDQDVLQLVSPQTKVLLTKKGISEMEEYSAQKVKAQFGVTPAQFTDFKGLVGDPSDNIPGIPGIGAKTAAKLLNEFSSLEEIILHQTELPLKLQPKIEMFAGQARLAKELVTIVQDVPELIEPEKCHWPGPDQTTLLAFFSRLEFKSLIRAALSQTKKGTREQNSNSKENFLNQKLTGSLQVDYRLITQPEDLRRVYLRICRAGQVAVTLKGNRENGVLQAAVSFKELNEEPKNFYLPLVIGHEVLSAPLKTLKDICQNPKLEILTHDGKSGLWWLKYHGWEIENLAFDTMIAGYLLNPGLSSYDLPTIALEHLNVVLPAGGEQALVAQANAVLRLAGVLAAKINLQGQEKLFYKVEMPLVKVLAAMEIAGVAVDKQQLILMAEEISGQIELLTQEAYVLAGEKFNLSSPKQLGQVLFEKLKLPVIKRTKTGYSTDIEVLTALAGTHPIIDKILTHRQLAKLKSTYIDGLVALINHHTGRLHTTFHQTGTATGRLSSANPNLQNIPVRMLEGRKIRRVFVPRQAGNLILTADYSQIELRVLAHLSGDKSLCSAFQEKQDIHVRTAAEVFNVDLTAVTLEMREKAKAVNFGIIYGMSDYGLARGINISRQEAKQYIEYYFARHPGVKKYIENTINQAREKGYVTTLLNRRRYLPDLFSSDRNIRGLGERMAINTTIQGSAADIIKLAMVHVHNTIEKRKLATQMILQVHDELIFDVPGEEVKEVKELVRHCMVNALPLTVPLEVDLKAGPNWYESGLIKE